MAAINGPGPVTVAVHGPPGPFIARTNYCVTGHYFVVSRPLFRMQLKRAGGSLSLFITEVTS